MLDIGWRFRRGLVRRPPTALHPRWGKPERTGLRGRPWPCGSAAQFGD